MSKQDYRLINHHLAELKAELIISHLSKCNPDWIQSHFTPTYSKIYFITEGEGRMMVGGQELSPQPGQLVFGPAGLPQYYSVTDPARTYRMYWCHFTSNLSFMNLFSLFKLPFCFTASDPDGTVSAFERLVKGYKSLDGPAKSIRIQASLLDVISCYIEQAVQSQPQAAAPLASTKLSAVLQYIDAHLSRQITLNELSELVHHHPNYFIRFFKQHLGVTPMNFIHERRLEKAKQLITVSDMSIGEIALSTGFHDIYHLSKAFKKSVGVSPTEFRSWSRTITPRETGEA